MDIDEVALDGRGLRVKPGILDAHLPHSPAGELFAVDLHGDGEMLFKRIALLVNRGRVQDRLGIKQKLPGVLENPWVADGASRDPDHVYARLAQHADGVLRGEDIA